MLKSCIYCTLLIGFLIISHGCSTAAGYKAGLYTRSVTGVLQTEDPDPAKQPFILVLDFHRTLLETGDGVMHRVSAFIAYPDELGKYSVPFSMDTAKLQLTFYAHNSLMNSQQFSRSLGIGRYQHNVFLKTDLDWKNSYYLMIKPTLIGFITEKRYQMNQRDIHFLGEWISAADERF